MNLTKLFALSLAALLLVSCKSLPEKFEEFVSEVEMNYEAYSDVDWMVMDQKCAEFKQQFIGKYDSLSQFEKEYMNKAFGRYDAVVVKAKAKGAASSVKRFFEGAGDYIQGLIEGVSVKDTVVTE